VRGNGGEGRVARSQKGVAVMTKAEQRRLALGAARVQLRRMGVNLDPFVPFKCVLEVLDDLHRAEPELVASQWYAQASDHQIQLLRREWKQAVKPVYERTLWQCFPKNNEFSEGDKSEKTSDT